MRDLSRPLSGFGAALYDFDNDGWKDLFVTGGHVESRSMPGQPADQTNFVFRNLGTSGEWQALTGESGLGAAPKARHRGCAFADLDGDGRIDVVVTALGKEAEMWMNRSQSTNHWLEIALPGTKSNREGIGARIKVTSKARGRPIQPHDHQRGLRFFERWAGAFRAGCRQQSRLTRDSLAIRHRADFS
jgi:hypothetical protein